MIISGEMRVQGVANDFAPLSTGEARLRFGLGAAEFASELGTAGEAIGRHVRVRVPVEMTFVTDGDFSEADASVLAPDDGSENAIEIYCGQVPPDSPFSAHAATDDQRAKTEANK